MTTTAESPRRIDVQFHFSPPFYTALFTGTPYIATDRWSVENALAYMDANGVAAGVMSVSTPGVDLLGSTESVALARRLNEAAAEVARASPGRFGNDPPLPRYSRHPRSRRRSAADGQQPRHVDVLHLLHGPPTGDAA